MYVVSNGLLTGQLNTPDCSVGGHNSRETGHVRTWRASSQPELGKWPTQNRDRKIDPGDCF